MKNFKPSSEMVKSAELVFLNMANVETIKPVVQKIQKDVLKEFQFKSSPKQDREFKEEQITVLEEKHTYKLNDIDFKKYHSECNKREAKKGLDVSNPEYCPLLVAEHELIKAENNLIDVFGEVVDIKASDIYKLEHRKRFIDITLRFMAQHINTKSVLLNLREETELFIKNTEEKIKAVV